MKKYSLLKISLVALLGFGALTSCVQDDKYDVPAILCTNQFAEPNTTIEEIKALAPTPVNFVSNYVIEDDLIFEGYVVSSDEEGNFYKSLSIQDKAENPTAGIQIAINKTFLYEDYPIGAKVRVKAKGLSVGIDRGVVKLGFTTPTGYLPGTQMRNFISGVCNGNTMEVATIVPVELNSLAEATQDKYLNTLVTIKDVQFSEANGTLTYGDAVNRQTLDRGIVDKDGNTAVLRNSGFANFAAQVMPTGSGNLTTVISKYTSGANVSWQFYIRGIKDVDFTGTRFAVGILGGENMTYATTLSEDFENLAVTGNFNIINDPKYINYAKVGDRYWEEKSFGGNKYMQASAFRANKDINTFFIMPVEFTGSSKLSFKSKAGYNTGSVLKVYYSTTYVAGGEVNIADLTDITDKFTIAVGLANGYDANFTDSGEFTIPATGKGHIFFEYTGNTTVTTNFQIDDVKVQ
ncbi:MAG: DUF5689 domain-containing protein [Cruoricaptor ignavus]|nr:DUF5689 domain-containing protein [Cruoricaptor ignavus]